MTSLDDRLASLERQRRMAAERRAQRLHEMLDAIAAWNTAHGEDRDYWRWMAQTALRDFRIYHLRPEAAAFAAAVQRSQAAAMERAGLAASPRGECGGSQPAGPAHSIAAP